MAMTLTPRVAIHSPRRRLVAAGVFLLALPAASLADVRPVCTLVVEAGTGAAVLREGDCGTRWSPASTFKVPLALMGFDAGILTSPETPEVPFRAGYVDWRPEWRRPATPRTWMRDSVVWYSQWLTPQLGLARMQAYLDAFDYGNRDLSGRPGDGDGLTGAWLGSSLQISPQEQVAFLRRMLDGGLPVSAAAVANTGAILDHGTTAGGWHVRGKTGAAAPRRADGSPDRAHPIGWFVGWAEKAGERVVFARLVQQEGADDIPPSWRARDAVLDDLFGAGGLAE